MNLFKNLGLSDELLSIIDGLKFTKPTEIQEKSISHILKGKDVIGESATGSGKTLAFGCGIVEHTNKGEGLQSLVLTPTRELAEQVKNSIKQLAYHKHLSILSIYGGVAIHPQIEKLRSADVVVATPGRLLDHLQRRTIDVSNVKIIVLDEADRMLDMGFIDDVEKIIRLCPNERQTLFFSATISQEIRDLSHRYMKDPVKVSAVQYVDPSKLKQTYYDISRNQKLSLLINLLKHESVEQAMIFCNTRKTTDFVEKNLKLNGIKTMALHGGLSQNKRTRTIKSFENGEAFVLICTDVAARGLHIDNVSHIYNYEIPRSPKDYVHRIGRTARAGEEGEAINLLCDVDYGNFSKIQQDYPDFDIQNRETPQLDNVQTVMVGRGPPQRGRHHQRRPKNRNPRRWN
jgi:ATP-dependent RNA helicase DeaD